MKVFYIVYYFFGNNQEVVFKFILYLTLCVCLIFIGLNNVGEPPLEVLGSGEYCIYSRDAVESPLIEKRIDSGIGFMYYCKSSDAAKLRPLFTVIDGESITLENYSAAKVFKILNYKKISSSYIVESAGGIYYGYSNKGLSFITYGSVKINLQVAVRGSVTTVGWPVILGGY